MANTPITLNDRNTIPWLGYGTGTAFWQQDCATMVTAAIKAGFTHLDGAQMYGNEESLGAGIAAANVPRSSLFITTKFHEAPEGKTVKDILQSSLQKLKLDYVDLFLIHTPMGLESKLKDLWKGMEEVKKEGLAKSIGVSNFRVQDLEVILSVATVIPAINQIEYHPHLQDTIASQLEFHKKHTITTASFAGSSPLFRAKGTAVDPVVASIAKRLTTTAGKPISENAVLMAWQKAKGIVFVTATKTESRLKEYLEAAEAPALTTEEVAAIDAAGAKEHHRHFMYYWPGKETD